MTFDQHANSPDGFAQLRAMLCGDPKAPTSRTSTLLVSDVEPRSRGALHVLTPFSRDLSS